MGTSTILWPIRAILAVISGSRSKRLHSSSRRNAISLSMTL